MYRVYLVMKTSFHALQNSSCWWHSIKPEFISVASRHHRWLAA